MIKNYNDTNDTREFGVNQKSSKVWCSFWVPGMLLTSILALKTAPMSLVIVLRNTSPLGTLVIERFYPEPLRISSFMLGSIFLMIAGGVTWARLVNL